MFKKVAVAVSLIALFGCSKQPQEAMENHDTTSVEIRGLEREGGSGPYIAGATEVFKLQADEGIQSVRWNATAGALNSSGDRASWKLPQPGLATISATVITRDGEEKTASWDFRIVSTDDSIGRARDALLATPIPVLDGGSTDATGSYCDLAYDSSGSIHLAFKNDSHPSLWYGVWNGSTWNVQLVDGMGFDTGGQVTGRIAMTLDSANNPHFVYGVINKGLYYATRSGTTWTRERIDTTLAAPNVTGRMAIALNPAASNRPTVIYEHQPSGSYVRMVVAARTAANTWTNTQLTFSSTPYGQYLSGDILFDSAGKLYIPHSVVAIGRWDGTTTTEWFNLGTAVGNVANFDTWANAAWAGTSKLVLRTEEGIFNVSFAATFSASTATWSAVEQAGSTVGDVAYSSKPYLLHLHGSNLELVSPNAQGFWTYTQLGTASNTAMALAVNSGGNPSICYQSGNRVMFQ